MSTPLTGVSLGETALSVMLPGHRHPHSGAQRRRALGLTGVHAASPELPSQEDSEQEDRVRETLANLAPEDASPIHDTDTDEEDYVPLAQLIQKEFVSSEKDVSLQQVLDDLSLSDQEVLNERDDEEDPPPAPSSRDRTRRVGRWKSRLYEAPRFDASLKPTSLRLSFYRSNFKDAVAVMLVQVKVPTQDGAGFEWYVSFTSLFGGQLLDSAVKTKRKYTYAGKECTLNEIISHLGVTKIPAQRLCLVAGGLAMDELREDIVGGVLIPDLEYFEGLKVEVEDLTRPDLTRPCGPENMGHFGSFCSEFKKVVEGDITASVLGGRNRADLRKTALLGGFTHLLTDRFLPVKSAALVLKQLVVDGAKQIRLGTKAYSSVSTTRQFNIADALHKALMTQYAGLEVPDSYALNNDHLLTKEVQYWRNKFYKERVKINKLRVKYVKKSAAGKLTAGQLALADVTGDVTIPTKTYNDFVKRLPEDTKSVMRTKDARYTQVVQRFNDVVDKEYDLKATDTSGTVVTLDDKKITELVILLDVLARRGLLQELRKKRFVTRLLAYDAKYIQNGYSYTSLYAMLCDLPGKVASYSFVDAYPLAIASEGDDDYLIHRLLSAFSVDESKLVFYDDDGNVLPKSTPLKDVSHIQVTRGVKEIDIGKGHKLYILDIVVCDLKGRWAAGQGTSKKCFACGKLKPEWVAANKQDFRFHVIGAESSPVTILPEGHGTAKCVRCREIAFEEALEEARKDAPNMTLESDDILRIHSEVMKEDRACRCGDIPDNAIPLEASICGTPTFCNVDCSRHNMKNNTEGTFEIHMTALARADTLTLGIKRFKKPLNKYKRLLQKELPSLANKKLGMRRLHQMKINGQKIDKKPGDDTMIGDCPSLSGHDIRRFNKKVRPIVVRARPNRERVKANNELERAS